MREVLSLQYNAATDSILVTVAAIKQSEHVPGTFVRQLGNHDPQASFDIAELPLDGQVAFRALLAWLLEAVEEKHTALASSPEALAAKAIAIANAEHQLKIREEQARRELARIETEAAARRKAAEEEAAALEAELEKKRAELKAKNETPTPAEPTPPTVAHSDKT